MNNKDLFNAINDIDEKFIEDAGKYLNDDDDTDPLHSGAVEIYPGETRFSPLKLVASIAAAAVFITGVSIAFNHYRGRIIVDPNTGEEVSIGGDDGSTGVVQNDNSAANIGTHAPQTDAPLPFEVIGPDNRQLWYDDITSVERFTPGLKDDDVPLLKEDLTEDNWFSLNCGFAYVAEPLGHNFNNIDSYPIDIGGLTDDLAHDFKRIQKGDTFMGLTVKEASSTITRLANNNEYDDDGKVTRVTALSHNYVEFEGEITADVYLINDNGTYYCVFRNGESQFPIMDYDIFDFLSTNEYNTPFRKLVTENGFQYAGEMPVLTLDETEVYTVERALSNSNYLKATAIFENISVESTQNLGSNNYTYNARMAKVTLSYVESVVTADNLSGETPFSAENEMQLRAILGSAETVEELQSSADAIKQLTECNNIKVYRGIANMAGEYGEEIPEGSITAGMVIALYNGDELIAAYKYLVYDLTNANLTHSNY